jgi:hypothetical protein
MWCIAIADDGFHLAFPIGVKAHFTGMIELGQLLCLLIVLCVFYPFVLLLLLMESWDTDPNKTHDSTHSQQPNRGTIERTMVVVLL